MELVVAVDQNWAIGNNGDQLVYIPEDLKHFKELTLGKTGIAGLFFFGGCGRESVKIVSDVFVHISQGFVLRL